MGPRLLALPARRRGAPALGASWIQARCREHHPPAAHPHLPPQPGAGGLAGAICPGIPSLPPRMPVACGVGMLPALRGASRWAEPGRWTVWGAGCKLCMMLLVGGGGGAYCAPTSQGHPPPLRGTPTTHPEAPTSHLGCTAGQTPISNQVHALRTLLCGPGQVQVPASPQGSGEGPAVPLSAQGRCGQAPCVLPARRQLSALGTSRFPASAAKEPSLPKLLRAAESVPGKASAGGGSPPHTPPARIPARQ